MTKVHCILVTPIKIKEKQKNSFFHIVTAHNAKLKYYIVQLKGTYKKPPTFVITLKRQMNTCTSLFNSILLFHIEPELQT